MRYPGFTPHWRAFATRVFNSKYVGPSMTFTSIINFYCYLLAYVALHVKSNPVAHAVACV